MTAGSLRSRMAAPSRESPPILTGPAGPVTQAVIR